jgi:hypothetical protein
MTNRAQVFQQHGDPVDHNVCTTHAVTQFLRRGINDFIESERLRLFGFRMILYEALRTGRGKASAELNGSDLISAMIRESKGKRRKLSKQAKADRAALLLLTLQAESLKVEGDTLATALPTPATKESIEQAAELLASLAATTVAAVLKDREGFRQAYRIIESRLHPDNGADRDAWEAFQNAAVLLERHHVAQERRRRLNGAEALTATVQEK